MDKNLLKAFNEIVEWITVKGNHIPVEEGQSKEDAITQFIEDKQGGGYSDKNKSNRSIAAELRGYDNATTLSKELGLPSKLIKQFLYASEWHHTNKNFQKTNYYATEAYKELKENGEISNKTIEKYDLNKFDLMNIKESWKHLQDYNKSDKTALIDELKEKFKNDEDLQDVFQKLQDRPKKSDPYKLQEIRRFFNDYITGEGGVDKKRLIDVIGSWSKEAIERRKKMNATNSIILGEDTGGKGRVFQSRFLQAGLVKYSFGVCLLTKETINKFVNTFIGCPVRINHKDITDENAKDERVGVVSDIWFNDADGWFWCKGVIFDDKAIELINNGYNVSCQYEITEYSDNIENKLHNGMQYDKEILNGKFEHLAIVDNPRYEGALIAVNALNKTEQKPALKEKQKEEYKATNEYKPILDYIENYDERNDKMNEETKNVFERLISALKAKNEADDKDKKAENEDVDKRDIIRQIMAIAGKEEASEDVKTIAKLAEKLAYDKSEAGTADNKAKNEEKEDKDKEADNCRAKNDKVDKRELIDQVGGILKGKVDDEVIRTIIGKLEEIAYDKSEAGTADNKAKNDDDEYKKLKDDVEKDVENCKAKNSMDALKELFYTGDVKSEKSYMSQKERIELGKKLF